MNFKEWCLKTFGIHSFAEGKIINQVFLPLTTSHPVIPPLLMQCGCYVSSNVNGQYGLILTKDSYAWLISQLRLHYTHGRQAPINETDFQHWLNGYFAKLGINHQQRHDYNNLPNIHVVLTDATHHAKFINYFSQFYPTQFSYDVGTNYASVVMPPWFLYELYRQYYQDPNASIHNTSDVATLKQHADEIKAELKEISNSEEIINALNKAHHLALDHDNYIGLSAEEASFSYATSLRAYATLNKDNLSHDQYTRLRYAADLLASDSKGILTNGLRYDTRHLGRIWKYYDAIKEKHADNDATTENLPLSELGDDGAWILKRIKDITADILYGVNKGPMKASRFLPDEKMQSDTNVIILQGGGRINHSAIYRIIKVGMLPDGLPAQPGQTPHHFDYYKVENNLGAGCHDADWHTRACTGTHVTKLNPFQVNANGEATPININPFTHPAEYEKHMAETIEELIVTERQLMLYREPIQGMSGEQAAPIGSKEGAEWTRLNNLKNKLSGTSHSQPVTYYAHDPLDTTKKFPCQVTNQRNYMQGGGSCPIFSIKSLVSSVAGPELSALHIDFLQRHNAAGHQHALKMRAKELHHRISALTPPAPTHQDKQPHKTHKVNAQTRHPLESHLGHEKPAVEIKHRRKIKKQSARSQKALEYTKLKIDQPIEKKEVTSLPDEVMPPQPSIHHNDEVIYKQKCESILRLMTDYESHLTSDLEKHKNDNFQYIRIKTKADILSELKEILHNPSKNNRDNLIDFIRKMRENRPDNRSIQQILSASRERETTVISAIYSILPVKGKTFIDEVIKIIGPELINSPDVKPAKPHA